MLNVLLGEAYPRTSMKIQSTTMCFLQSHVIVVMPFGHSKMNSGCICLKMRQLISL